MPSLYRSNTFLGLHLPDITDAPACPSRIRGAVFTTSKWSYALSTLSPLGARTKRSSVPAGFKLLGCRDRAQRLAGNGDWHKAATYLAPECVIEWSCSDERIVGRSDFANMKARYPTNTGRWSFDVHRLVADGDGVVSEVTVTGSQQSARVVAFSEPRAARLLVRTTTGL